MYHDKKLGYLIYNKEEAVKNATFVEMFQNAGKTYGIEFLLMDKTRFKQEELPDFVLNRTRDEAVSRWYEKKKILSLHSSFLTELGNDKYKTYEYLLQNLPKDITKKKWAAKTCLLPVYQKEDESYQSELRKLITNFSSQKSLILKTVDGHGGNEVTKIEMVENMKEDKANKDIVLDKIISFIKQKPERRFLLQDEIQGESQDVRVYILGGRIYQAVLRQGKNDFRSNFSLGGTVSAYKLSESQKEYIQKFIDVLGGEELAMAGIDFIIDEEQNLIFNEVEEMVGSRMLYQSTDKDIVTDYVRWLYERYFLTCI